MELLVGARPRAAERIVVAVKRGGATAPGGSASVRSTRPKAGSSAQPTRPGTSSSAQFAAFLARYAPEVAACARGVLARLRKQLPGAVELVYDNYNGLVVGFGPNERASDAVLSVALYPRWVTLFFLDGRRLADPQGLLEGDGKIVRRITLAGPADLDRAAVKALVRQAVRGADPPIDPRARRRMLVKSVSARQRSRRPS